MDKHVLIKQTDLAFEFINKLFVETSILIKEVEGILKSYGFNMLKPKGYQIIVKSITGIEAAEQWLYRKYSVGFVKKTDIKRGRTDTIINELLELLYMRFVLSDSNEKEPVLYFGKLFDIEIKEPGKKYFSKFEGILAHIEYNDVSFFNDITKIDYENALIKCKRELFKLNLYDIKNKDDIFKKIIKPFLGISQNS